MKIVVFDPMDERIVEEIKKMGEVVYLPKDKAEAVKDAEIAIVRSATKMKGELLEKGKKLKLIIRAGVGLDNIDLEECKKRNIEVRNTPGASTNAVAELAVAMIIGIMRNMGKAHHGMKEKKWEKKLLKGEEISGKTLGIIGYGRIGSEVGKKMNALGMKIIAYNPPPRREDNIVEYVNTINELYNRADVITIHAVLTPETRGMINKEAINKMKDGVYIINLARAEIIEEDALFEGLKSGKIKGVALDVYWKEPYDGKLLELENVILTPHIGANTKEAQRRIGEEVLRIIEEFQKQK